MASVKALHAREILDSRGNPTLEVEVTTDGGTFRAEVPSGASTGTHEAKELRDNDSKRYAGKGVLLAVDNVKQIIGPKVIGFEVIKQVELDRLLIELDGTTDMSKLGSNAILGVSLAVARAAAAFKHVPLYRHIADLAGIAAPLLPVPAFNVLNGGEHAGNTLAFQEFLLVPVGAPNFREALRMGAETYHVLKSVIKEKYGMGAVNVGDEGGFAPSLSHPREALKLLKEAITKAGYTGVVRIGIDAAASSFYDDQRLGYNLNYKRESIASSGKPLELLSGEQLASLYLELAKEFDVVFIEDPFDEEDWDSFSRLTSVMNGRVEVIGDDLLVTNVARIRTGIQKKAVSALLLKLNQIGTLSETIEACALARLAGWHVMVSHRSGETEDPFIAHLVVGLGVGQIKSGAPCRSERLIKYNELMRIEEELAQTTQFAKFPFPGWVSADK